MRYICFIKISGSIDNSNNTYAKQYIDYNQMNQKLVNKLNFDKFKLDKDNKNYQSAELCYIISEVLDQFFFIAISK